MEELDKTLKMCYENRVGLLYMSMVGSYLYGTNGQDSDKDYRFIFLEPKKNLLLGKQKKIINYSSGNNGSKNSKDDVDIQGWSLHYFIHLLKKGETNAIDLLYSITNKSCPIFFPKQLSLLFHQPTKFFNIKDVNSYLGFGNSQAIRYGIRGKRMKVIKNILEDRLIKKHFDSDEKLSSYSSYIIKEYYDKKYCYLNQKDGIEYLNICDSLHLTSITMSEFLNRMSLKYKEYGERSKKAMINDGNDYKALSHSYRCYLQYISLIKYHKIDFPFVGDDLKHIVNIKSGVYEPKTIIKMISKFPDIIDEIKPKKMEDTYDKKYVEDFILNFY